MKPKTLAIVGCGTLAIGRFLTLVNEPIVGQTTYVLNGDGRIVGLLAVVGFFLAIVNLTGWTAIPGVLCLGLIGHTFYVFAMRQGVTPDIAWPVVLTIGAVMLVAASCMQELKGLSWKGAVRSLFEHDDLCNELLQLP
jgi:peptidoglycan/LPS O-acetylase OafA/YrhL